MSSALLTESWAAVQRLVEDLRPLTSRICCATDAEALELRPELIHRLQALSNECRLAKHASEALTKGVLSTIPGTRPFAADQASGDLQQSLPKSVQQKDDLTPSLPPQQQQHQQAPSPGAAQQTVPAVKQSSLAYAEHSQSPSPKPAPGNDEAPRFPFSIVKPARTSRQSWQQDQRQPTGSLPDLPLGAVAVPLPQGSARTSLPSSASLDAHAQAALHTVPLQSLSSAPPDSQEALHVQESAPASVQTHDGDATDGQTGLVAGANQPSPLAAPAQHSTSTPDTCLPVPAASALGNEEAYASTDCTSLQAASAPMPHKQATSTAQGGQRQGQCENEQASGEPGSAALTVDTAQAPRQEQEASDSAGGASSGFVNMPADQHGPVVKKRRSLGT